MKPIEVPMQGYAGKLLIIEHLVVPDISDDLQPGNKTTSASKYGDISRPTFFDPKVIEKTLNKYCTQEGITNGVPRELVEALLAAVETYMKSMMQYVIELCEHRTSCNLYGDPRCELQHNMRTTMMFLNDREVADYGYSDDDSTYGHRKRWMKLQRNRIVDTGDNEMRMETTNKTAMLALGARKQAVATAAKSTLDTPGPTAPRVEVGVGGRAAARTEVGARVGARVGGAELPERSFIVRIKHINVKDIIQYMEEHKRFSKSKLLYDAYLTYKW